MPTIPFDSLTDIARVWIFASDKPLGDSETSDMLRDVDRYLAGWHAHGSPLTCAREWRDNRFLTIGVEGADASGCSIDGLFRTLERLERTMGASLVGEGFVFYKDKEGQVVCATRDEFRALAEDGTVGLATRVFDTSLTSLGEYRDKFESSAGDSWHRKLLRIKTPAGGQPTASG